MSLASSRQELLELLHREEERLSSKLPPQGFGLIDIARSMDNYWVNVSHVYSAEKLDLESLNTQMEFGLNKALKILLQDVYKYPTILLTPTNRYRSTWADTFIQSCGKLGWCEQLLEIHRVGLCELTKLGDTYRFNINIENAGIETIERAHFDWAVLNAVKNRNKLISNKRKERRELFKEMSKIVQMASKYYMTYDTNPRIDNYYIEIGKSDSARMFGRDSFPDHVKFGGIEFGLYCEAVEIMVGWALKHIDYAFLLLKKRPQMNFRNLCTLLDLEFRIFDYLQSALGVDDNTCKQIIKTVTLRQNNIDDHCAIPGDFVAPAYIDVGMGKLVSPIWGNLTHPFTFLLTELKRQYKDEGFRNVNEREKIFQDEIYRLFDGDRYYKYPGQLDIKRAGVTLTDIDALIFDKLTGKIAIFQLKFQDAFGHSLRQRSNRKLDMLKANKWIGTITDWIRHHSEKDLAQRIGISNYIISKNNFRLFVIGRNAANFSGAEMPDSRAAWGIWLQIHRFRENFSRSADPIEVLFSSIAADSPFQKELPEIGISRVTVRDKEIIFGKFT
jgi:hypothetical protein